MRQSARPRQKGNDRAAPKQASEGPGEGEARFRAIAELSGDWYWEQDASHRFTWAFVRGGSAGAVSSIIGKTGWELGEEPLNGTWEEHRRLLDARQPFRDLHVRLVDENGAEHFFSTTGVPTFDSAGIFTGYRGLARRITQRKRAEQLLWLEHTVARSVTEADSVAAALKAVIRAVCEAQDWECGRFF
ncbi:MAG TPA: PAS domain-containing protein, partial [Burkholderiales bacterium]|nr:PAS domain-containing protein [Burkholderiales bacterium]